MFPLYDVAIAPVLRAAGARRVVEIGALRGDNTVLLLDLLGPEGELHVIDPVPQFDPEEHAARFPGRYVFHRGISHDVLPTLPPCDAALVDGDHNWYTVHRELHMLAATAREAGAPLPVLILHDVGWPYGRRDLYYSPERIPAEHRQPYAQRGMAPGRPNLLKRGGLNATLHNAKQEGGPRNGVMTALEDFVAEHDRPLRMIVLPTFFGLAVVAEEERLAANPALAAAFDRLEGAEGRGELLEVAESIRITELTNHHKFFFAAEGRAERSAQRYLEVVKQALLDEHYLENEVRISYLAKCLKDGVDADPLKLRDPARWMQRQTQRVRNARRAGLPVADDESIAPLYPWSTLGRTGLDRLQYVLDVVRLEAVTGDVVACGAWRGGTAIFLRAYLDAYELAGRDVWVADPFRGDAESGGDLNVVRDGFDRFGLLDDRVRFLQGGFADTLADAPIERVAVLHVDTESGDDATEVLERLYDRVAVGGFVTIRHADDPSCWAAVEAFRARRGITDPIERTDAAGAGWRKTVEAPAAALPVRESPARAPVVRRAPTDATDLSVVVVFYNMRREAARTLHSLTPAYQRGIDDLDYEVIVVENGSAPDQKLGEDFVTGFGPQFRYLDLGESATPSPANAINRGIDVARGKALALMIDGAHVLTPGVLRFGMLGLRSYAPAVVAAHQWYVGPGQQGDAMDGGYDQAYEDRLFEAIEWPADGYRLFEVGHPIGERDWLDGMWESNCIFVPRSVLKQVGGMDESFAMAGGGYANLDFYERVGATPGVTLVAMMGEGSFHQLHGGTTTNQPDAAERQNRIADYREHYEALRGRPFRGPGKAVHYVGSMIESARRSRPRRMTAPAFKQAQALGEGGMPAHPVPVPDELRDEFTDAFWRSLAWRDTTWLGRRVKRAPTDLLAYQELVVRLRPDWIVETRTGDGGRAHFLASICDLVGHGRVLTVDDRSRPNRPEHPRLVHLAGDPLAPEVLDEVRATVQGSALVFIGSRRRNRVVQEFEAYSPLVPVGSYVVVEDTVLNGHPAYPEHGPGPAEAVKVLLKHRRDFVPDTRLEKYALTFNPRGYLKRVL